VWVRQGDLENPEPTPPNPTQGATPPCRPSATPHTFITARTIVNLFALGAVTLSFTHIVALCSSIHMGWQSWLAPAFIDGLALLGRLGQSKRFAAKTRRAGHRLMLSAGLLSLAANIGAGHNLGERIFGAMVVVGFVVAEWYAAQLAPVTPRTRRTAPATATATQTPATPAVPAAKTTRRCPAGCTCGKHNRRPSTARIAAQVAAIETLADLRFQESDAPVSPAPAGSSNFGYL
jgi:hypothetical protein